MESIGTFLFLQIRYIQKILNAYCQSVIKKNLKGLKFNYYQLEINVLRHSLVNM